MNNDILDRIKQFNDSKISFEPGWAWKVYENIENIICANGWEGDEVLENIPEKLQTVFLLLDLQKALLGDGFFSVFYNETPNSIKRLRHAIRLAELTEVGEIFDEALRLVKSKFSWTNEDINFVTQMMDEETDDPEEFFGDEISGQFEEFEDRVYAIFFNEKFEMDEKFEELLETYVNG